MNTFWLYCNRHILKTWQIAYNEQFIFCHNIFRIYAIRILFIYFWLIVLKEVFCRFVVFGKGLKLPPCFYCGDLGIFVSMIADCIFTDNTLYLPSCFSPGFLLWRFGYVCKRDRGFCFNRCICSVPIFLLWYLLIILTHQQFLHHFYRRHMSETGN